MMDEDNTQEELLSVKLMRKGEAKGNLLKDVLPSCGEREKEFYCNFPLKSVLLESPMTQTTVFRGKSYTTRFLTD